MQRAAFMFFTQDALAKRSVKAPLRNGFAALEPDGRLTLVNEPEGEARIVQSPVSLDGKAWAASIKACGDSVVCALVTLQSPDRDRPWMEERRPNINWAMETISPPFSGVKTAFFVHCSVEANHAAVSGSRGPGGGVAIGAVRWKVMGDAGHFCSSFHAVRIPPLDTAIGDGEAAGDNEEDTFPMPGKTYTVQSDSIISLGVTPEVSCIRARVGPPAVCSHAGILHEESDVYVFPHLLAANLHVSVGEGEILALWGPHAELHSTLDSPVGQKRKFLLRITSRVILAEATPKGFLVLQESGTGFLLREMEVDVIKSALGWADSAWLNWPTLLLVQRCGSAEVLDMETPDRPRSVARVMVPALRGDPPPAFMHGAVQGSVSFIAQDSLERKDSAEKFQFRGVQFEADAEGPVAIVYNEFRSARIPLKETPGKAKNFAKKRLPRAIKEYDSMPSLRTGEIGGNAGEQKAEGRAQRPSRSELALKEYEDLVARRYIDSSGFASAEYVQAQLLSTLVGKGDMRLLLAFAGGGPQADPEQYPNSALFQTAALAHLLVHIVLALQAEAAKIVPPDGILSKELIDLRMYSFQPLTFLMELRDGLIAHFLHFDAARIRDRRVRRCILAMSQAVAGFDLAALARVAGAFAGAGSVCQNCAEGFRHTAEAALTLEESGVSAASVLLALLGERSRGGANIVTGIVRASLLNEQRLRGTELERAAAWSLLDNPFFPEAPAVLAASHGHWLRYNGADEPPSERAFGKSVLPAAQRATVATLEKQRMPCLELEFRATEEYALVSGGEGEVGNTRGARSAWIRRQAERQAVPPSAFFRGYAFPCRSAAARIPSAARVWSILETTGPQGPQGDGKAEDQEEREGDTEWQPPHRQQLRGVYRRSKYYTDLEYTESLAMPVHYTSRTVAEGGESPRPPQRTATIVAADGVFSFADLLTLYHPGARELYSLFSKLRDFVWNCSMAQCLLLSCSVIRVSVVREKGERAFLAGVDSLRVGDATGRTATVSAASAASTASTAAPAHPDATHPFSSLSLSLSCPAPSLWPTSGLRAHFQKSLGIELLEWELRRLVYAGLVAQCCLLENPRWDLAASCGWLMEWLRVGGHPAGVEQEEHEESEPPRARGPQLPQDQAHQAPPSQETVPGAPAGAQKRAPADQRGESKLPAANAGNSAISGELIRRLAHSNPLLAFAACASHLAEEIESTVVLLSGGKRSREEQECLEAWQESNVFAAGFEASGPCDGEGRQESDSEAGVEVFHVARGARAEPRRAPSAYNRFGWRMVHSNRALGRSGPFSPSAQLLALLTAGLRENELRRGGYDIMAQQALGCLFDPATHPTELSVFPLEGLGAGQCPWAEYERTPLELLFNALGPLLESGNLRSLPRLPLMYAGGGSRAGGPTSSPYSMRRRDSSAAPSGGWQQPGSSPTANREDADSGSFGDGTSLGGGQFRGGEPHSGSRAPQARLQRVPQAQYVGSAQRRGDLRDLGGQREQGEQREQGDQGGQGNQERQECPGSRRENVSTPSTRQSRGARVMPLLAEVRDRPLISLLNSIFFSGHRLDQKYSYDSLLGSIRDLQGCSMSRLVERSSASYRRYEEMVKLLMADDAYRSVLTGGGSPACQSFVLAVMQLRMMPKQSHTAKIQRGNVLRGMLVAMASATPVRHRLQVQFDHEAGVDMGGLFRAALTLAFEELISEKPIGFEETWDRGHSLPPQQRALEEEMLPPEPILRAVSVPGGTMLIPKFLGHTPTASTEVLPRISPKRSALYYLGRLCCFALVHNLRIPDMLDSRFWQCVVGGRLFLEEEEIQNDPELRDACQRDAMFRINGTPVDLVFPLEQAAGYGLYRQNLDLLNEINREAEKCYKAACESAAGRGEPDRSAVRFEWTDMAALNSTSIAACKLRETVWSAQAYCAEARNAILSGRAFRKHFSEFRNGFRQSFGTIMLASTPPEHQGICKGLDRAFKDMTVEEFRSFAVAPTTIIREVFVDLFQPSKKSCFLAELVREQLAGCTEAVSVGDVLSVISETVGELGVSAGGADAGVTGVNPGGRPDSRSNIRLHGISAQAAQELALLPAQERPTGRRDTTSRSRDARALRSICVRVVERLLRHQKSNRDSEERCQMVRRAACDPSLFTNQDMSDILFAATGGRYTTGIQIQVTAQDRMRYVVFHTCSRVIEVPHCDTAREMADVLLNSAKQGNEDGFGLV